MFSPIPATTTSKKKVTPASSREEVPHSKSLKQLTEKALVIRKESRCFFRFKVYIAYKKEYYTAQ